jgi:hypothetical protein
LFIAIRAFYELSLWITPHLLFTYQTCTTGCYARDLLELIFPLAGKQPSAILP